MQVARYPYGEEFQFKILALLVQDPVFLATHFDAVHPNYFERVHLSTVCQLVLNHFHYYRVAPDYASLSAWVEDHCQRCRVPEEVSGAVRNTVWWIFSNTVYDPDHVKDKVLRFGQRQAMKGAVNDIIDKLERDEDYEECRNIVERALQVGMQKDSGMDMGQNLLWLPQIVAQSNLYSRRIKTMLPSLDRCLGGGLGIGEFGVVIAPSGVGKSMTLCNFGYGAILAGFNVLHVTLELKELDIALRYAARHTGQPINSIIENDPNFYNIAVNNPIGENRLRIKYFSPGTATTANIRALMSYLRAQHFYPDLLIVDYIKKMKHDGEMTGSLGKIADELITIGDDFKCGVWTAQQAQRNYRFKKRTDVSGIANDISIIENADVALALSQDENEHREDRVRIETGKIRRGDDTYIICCWLNYKTGSMHEMDEGQVAALYGRETSGGGSLSGGGPI